jgi:hypothetical protein
MVGLSGVGKKSLFNSLWGWDAVNQMIGRFAVNSSALKRLHQQACVLVNRFLNVRYTHIGREQNLLADALAFEAAAGRAWQIARGDDVLDR